MELSIIKHTHVPIHIKTMGAGDTYGNLISEVCVLDRGFNCMRRPCGASTGNQSPRYSQVPDVYTILQYTNMATPYRVL